MRRECAHQGLVNGLGESGRPIFCAYLDQGLRRPVSGAISSKTHKAGMLQESPGFVYVATESL